MEKALYKITNLINNKIYIGQSLHPERRWVEHRCHASRHDDDYPVHLAISKYGEKNFSFEILEWSENYDVREAELIREFNSLVPNGYNILDGTSNNPVMYGENHPRNTISQKDVDSIIQELLENKVSDVALADKYSTTPKIIADINHGISHKKENLSYSLRQRKGRTGGISMETRMNIIEDLKNTQQSYSQLANKYGVSKGLIGHINHGRYNKVEGIEYPIRRT